MTPAPRAEKRESQVLLLRRRGEVLVQVRGSRGDDVSSKIRTPATEECHNKGSS